MLSHTLYFAGMMVFTLTSQMYHRISVLVPVFVRGPEYLSTSTSTSTSTMTFELTSTSTVRVPEIQYSSTASTSTEYEYPSPGDRPIDCIKWDMKTFAVLHLWCYWRCKIYMVGLKGKSAPHAASVTENFKRKVDFLPHCLWLFKARIFR